MRKEGHIDFSIVREDFNEYELEDGLLLRVKPTVIDIITKNDSSRSGFTLIFEVFSKVISSPFDLSHNRGYSVNSPINFRTLKNVVNIYEIETAIILFNFQLRNLFLTNEQDSEEHPTFRTEGDGMVKVVEKPSIVNVARGNISNRDKSIFKSIFWARVSERYRYVRRNTNSTDFIFEVDGVRRPIQEGGLGIAGFEQPFVELMLREIQDQEGLIELIPNRRFRLTRSGKEYCRRLPVTYG